jgi:NAD(P)-dependent dehydrogenase (short-subunit alcohol dehydrogenase family)
MVAMKHVLITGANRGIGLEFARQYLEEGDLVVATCRNPEGAKELKKLRELAPHQLIVHLLDVAREEEITVSAATISQELEWLDLLINNAGVFPENRIDSAKTEDLLEAFHINSVAPFLVSRAFTGLLSEAESPLIVNISSLLGSVSVGAGIEGWEDYAYGPSKAALNRITRQLAFDLKPHGIAVIAQNPGWVRTDMGGLHAPLSAEEAVCSMRALFSQLTIADSGRIVDSDGKDAAW